MAIVILSVGAFLTLMGVVGYLYGLDAMPSERGVAGVISASVAFVGGIITIALGLVLKRMEELTRLPPAARQRPSLDAVDPPAVATAPGPAEDTAPIELPKIVPVERPRDPATRDPATDDAPPVRPVLPSVKGASLAVGAGVAAAAATGAAAAAAGREAVEKALDFDFPPSEPPSLPRVAPLEARPLPLEPLDLPKPDMPKLELPKLDLPKLEIPKLDVPKRDLPELDSPSLDRAAKDETAAAGVAGERAGSAELASREHEVEYPVEVLAPVVAAPDSETEADAGVEDFERELERLMPLQKAAEDNDAKAEPDEDDELPAAERGAEPATGKADADAADEAAPEAPALTTPAPVQKPAPGAEVVGAYESGGAKYTMYSDGSVVAEAGGETLFFKSLEELRDFIDAGVKS